MGPVKVEGRFMEASGKEKPAPPCGWIESRKQVASGAVGSHPEAMRVAVVRQGELCC